MRCTLSSSVLPLLCFGLLALWSGLCQSWGKGWKKVNFGEQRIHWLTLVFVMAKAFLANWRKSRVEMLNLLPEMQDLKVPFAATPGGTAPNENWERFANVAPLGRTWSCVIIDLTHFFGEFRKTSNTCTPHEEKTRNALGHSKTWSGYVSMCSRIHSYGLPCRSR